MKFLSTRGGDSVKSAAYAIAQGLSSDGGLFVPEYFPNVREKLKDMLSMDYAERAAFVMGQYLTEYDQKDLLNACINAYSKFEENDPAPIVKLDEGFYVMELFHGPTLAFKDVALTILPYLLRKGADISGVKEDILILVATSGDTGKAALEGFKDADGIKILVFYPSEGVSDMQKLQMRTQEGNNVLVAGVKGNFDDCQNTVKRLFSDIEFSRKLKENNIVLSSANSINFGRLVPQITYYFSAYLDLVDSGEISLGDKINFVVPTGNFGNILAGYYAKQMGLPIEKLVCASNSNNVLTEFFVDGTYDRNREFFKTISPSMDILISSNLERLIFELSGRDASLTKSRMEELKTSGKYALEQSEVDKLEQEFFADFSDEDECYNTILDIFDEYGYVIDPHTAVAVKVKNSFDSFTDNECSTVVLSTASPYKFPENVLKAITGKKGKDAFDSANKLLNESAMPIPQKITELKNKQVRFDLVIDKGQAEDTVMQFVKK